LHPAWGLSISRQLSAITLWNLYGPDRSFPDGGRGYPDPPGSSFRHPSGKQKAGLVPTNPSVTRPFGTFRGFIPAGIKKHPLQETGMSVFRFDKNSAPTRDQRERYMIGEIDEKHFGPGGQIVLIEYPEAVYLRDHREHIGILFTGSKDKHKAFEEVTRLIGRHDHERNSSTGTA